MAFTLSMNPLVLAQEENALSEQESAVEEGANTPVKASRKRFKLKLPPAAKEMFDALLQGETKVVEAVFRPMEFREPIATIPAEGRFGVGFYGWKGLNFLKIHPNSIMYEEDVEDRLSDISFSGRMGSFLEMEGGQTNLSYALFGKSYMDILTGLGVRYSSIFPFPRMELRDDLVITGPPTVPESWGIDREFSPSVMEINIVSSYIMRWHPKWFIHLKYSYGVNYTRFYKDERMDSSPYGTGTSSAYSVGLKIITESPTEARYAWGLELRHIYHDVRSIKDPLEITPITRIKLPNLGIFFTFSAFYGGRKTVGDEAKKLFLEKDYVAARPKFLEFMNAHPNHARMPRARKLLDITNKRIPYQIYAEGGDLQGRKAMDAAADKYVEALTTAEDTLIDRLQDRLDELVEFYVSEGTELFEARQYEEALVSLGKASALTEEGKRAQNNLRAKILMAQGYDLAAVGLYTLAIEKYDAVPELDRTLTVKAKRAAMKAAVGMVGDVNKASDIASLRLALKSLKTARDMFAPAEFKYNDYITSLETLLSAADSIAVRREINLSLEEAREVLERRHMPRLETGMLVSDVEDLLGAPDEVVEEVKGKDGNYQMWIYNLPDRKKRLLYFENYILFKIRTG
ncbi:MAG: hypothetical protein VX822_03310 [Candidatus Neomarinimicrobiota bacterium]|nr:hypothetical protein [Candidatus Neomarinimicrobiota bacterium]